MKRTTSIQVRAALLLMVFALNTVIGFVCSMGIEMRFNYKHHDEETVASHHHDEKEDADKDRGCCNGPVVKFQQLDKNTNQNAKINLDSPLTIILHALYGIDILNTAATSISKYIVPQYYPPPPDIRIAIQSFQI